MYFIGGGGMDESKRKDLESKEAESSSETNSRFTLEELLEKCKPDNRHEEIDLGIEGRELI